MRLVMFCLLCALLSSGCHRTVYTNLHGSARTDAPSTVQLDKLPDFDDTTWQHFFLFGWVPDEKIIDAAAACGGREQVAAIKTRQTFVEGLVAQLSGNYVNIYSPYDGHVVCINSKKIRR